MTERDTPRPFKAKNAGECASCGLFKVGDLIVKLPVPALFERPKSVWTTRGQYRKVSYSHHSCFMKSEARRDELARNTQSAVDMSERGGD